MSLKMNLNHLHYLFDCGNYWSFAFDRKFCLHFILLLSHSSDQCSHCQFCSYAVSTHVCPSCHFVYSSGTNVSVFSGALALANEFLSDSSVTRCYSTQYSAVLGTLANRLTQFIIFVWYLEKIACFLYIHSSNYCAS